jgi:fatty acid desaturase
MKRLDTLLHLMRLGASIAVLVVFREHALVAAAVAMGIYFASFSFTHDLAHGALRLPRRANEWALSLAALPSLVSGHSMRLMHQRHHARPLAGDDFEGVGAAVSLWRAVLVGPQNGLAVRTHAWAAANPRERRWIFLEYAVIAVAAALALASGFVAAQLWVAVCLALHLTASAWASHLPHHPPPLLRRIALRLAWTGSVSLLGFAFHDEHHAHPKVPCRALAAL